MNPVKPEIGLSIVIPVYNSAETLPDLVGRLANLPIKGKYELILVNDGSQDNSAEICRQLTETAGFPVTFVDLSRNFGEHNAVMAGLHQARGKYIVNIDDDFQNPPEEIVRVYEHALKGNYDVVYTRYPERHHSVWRVWAS
ncbi:MAG: glycosyltransferase family 2 protein, partial [Pontiellaceae bacterium]|nr:glycosyltransferase family 2 protein [Pontiellaceae bacterium]